MSFRYKSALLTLVSLAAIYSWYFARVANGIADDGAMPLLLGVVLAIAVAQIAGHAIIAATSSDRWGPMDERERSIDRRATSVGYYTLIVSVLAAAATVHWGTGSARMANAILLAIVVSECARQSVFLLLHHRTA